MAEVEALKTPGCLQRKGFREPISLPKPSVAASSYFDQMAEGEGFEPPGRLPAQQLSRLPRSTTLPPLRVGGIEG